MYNYLLNFDDKIKLKHTHTEDTNVFFVNTKNKREF